MFTIHENEVKGKELPGRMHKMIIGPDNFGKSERMCFGIAYFPPRAHAPTHVHPKEEEIIYILTGSGEIIFDEKPESVTPGTCVYIPPRVKHSINNTGTKKMKVIYVFSPPVVQGSYG